MNTPDQYQNDQFSQNTKQTTLRSRPTGLSLSGPPSNYVRATSNDPEASPASAPSMLINIDPKHYHGNDNQGNVSRQARRPVAQQSRDSDEGPATDPGPDRNLVEHQKKPRRVRYKESHRELKGVAQG